MKAVLSNLKIQVNEKIFVKDPETSVLGKKIIAESIVLIDQMGFEDFTFRKLGERIGSNESSVYRYFESKHKLMLYLSSLYWGWIEYRLVFATTNVADASEKLRKAITVVTQKVKEDSATIVNQESILNNIIIAEFTKTFLTKVVDRENNDGFFLVYKRVINRLIEIITEVNPDYPYAKNLASSVVEGALHQHFLKDHFKTITNSTSNDSVTEFYIDLVEKILSK